MFNISLLSTNLELCSEIALPRKPFGIGFKYVYSFLLRMTDTMTSRNTDLFSWDTPVYRYILSHRIIVGVIAITEFLSLSGKLACIFFVYMCFCFLLLLLPRTCLHAVE
jgi:hypothetical protein